MAFGGNLAVRGRKGGVVIKKITEGVKGGAIANKVQGQKMRWGKSGGGESKNKKRLLTPRAVDFGSVKNP